MKEHSLSVRIIRVINALVPKNKRKVVFDSFPDYADSSRAVFEYMRTDDRFKEYTFVWIVRSGSKSFQSNKNIFFINSPNKRFSIDYIKYLYHIFTSKYLFATHTSFLEANPSVQSATCVWHGTMLKSVGGLNEREKNEMVLKDQFKFFVCASHFYLDIYEKVFLLPRERFIVTGTAKGDFLFEESSILKELGVYIQPKSKLVVYMPTFRKVQDGKEYDVDEDSNERIISFSEETKLFNLSSILRDKNVTLLVKWHPADANQNMKVDVPNVLFVDNKLLSQKGLEFYHVLHYADALITDYSSVFCDFLLLDRPIAFDISDFDKYSSGRGFVFDKPIDYMPGYLMRNPEDFIEFITDLSDGRDKSVELRRQLFHIYNDYSDGCSSKRILETVIESI